MKYLLLIFALFASSMYAGELQTIQKEVTKWQKEFGIASWTVNVHVESEENIVKMLLSDEPDFAQAFMTPLYMGHIYGSSVWDPEQKTGEIFILQGSDYKRFHLLEEQGLKPKDIPKDQENTIVHEMLHNVWRNADDEERAVTWLAQEITRDQKIYHKSKKKK